MDAPNAPNPANPNAQDQNVDAVQGPTNQVQGPAVQNQAQVPAGQIPAQIPAVPVQGPCRLVKMCQFNHHHNQFQYNWSLLVW